MGFLSSGLFTNEATFGHDGIINPHNRHLWATDNAHRMVEVSHQQWFSINVWAGIIGDRLLGPVLPEWRNVSDLPAKHAASIAGEFAFGNMTM